VYEIMAENVNKWGQEVIGEYGYSSVGAVVGATFPEQARTLRKLMPKAIFLVPGYGAQGGGADDVVPCFNEGGRGAIVNSSRGIIFTYQSKGNDEKFALFAKEAAEQMKDDLNSSLKKAGII
jgi:orotidine-5'-phosphate decarboxylase